MTVTSFTYYGKRYIYDRSTRLKKDAVELAKDWERDGDKLAIVRMGKNAHGERVWHVYWRRK